MFIKGSSRKSVRKPFVRPLRYSLSNGNLSRTKPLLATAVTVDISAEGIGIVTDHPLAKGNVLKFKNSLKMKEEVLKSEAVVVWTGLLQGKHRVGLKFLQTQ